jgi:hypothetical protein
MPHWSAGAGRITWQAIWTVLMFQAWLDNQAKDLQLAA